MKKAIAIVIVLLILGLGITVGVILSENKREKISQAIDKTEVHLNSTINSKSDKEVSMSASTGVDKTQNESVDEKKMKVKLSTESAIDIVKKVFSNNPLKMSINAELQTETYGGEQDYFVLRVFNDLDVKKDTVTVVMVGKIDGKVYLTIPPDGNGHGTRRGEEVNKWDPESDMSYISFQEKDNIDIEKKGFNTIASKLADETLKAIFAGHALDDLDGLVKKLGKPVKEIDESNYTYKRWYFADGIEVDIASEGVDHETISNYVYISPGSNIKTSRNIGIGSSRSEVFEAYKNEINPDETNDNRIVVGNSSAVVFIMKNNKVDSIFIGTGYFIGEDTEIYFTQRNRNN